MLNKIAPKYGIEYRTGNDTWFGALSYGRISKPIVGFDLGLNSSTTKEYCDNKTATTFRLNQENIPNVQHQFFTRKAPDVWAKIVQFGKEHHFNVVCKPKSGTCGNDVFHAKSELQLQTICKRMFESYPDLSLSPFLNITNEYRVILLNQQAELAFKKNRPSVIATGKDTLRSLIQNFAKDCTEADNLWSEWDSQTLDSTPPEGQVVLMNWKHNLCRGASSTVLTVNESLPIIDLASKAAAAVNGIFVSVDVIECADKSLRVLEINNGIMMRFVMEEHGEPMRQIASTIHEKAVCQLFSIAYRPSLSTIWVK